MKKLLLLFVALVATSMTALADIVEVNALAVFTKDGVKTTFILQEKPEVFFEGFDLRVVSEKQDVSFPVSNLLRFTFEKQDYDGITERKKEEPGLNFKDGMLVVSQVEAGKQVCIYAADGKLLRTITPRRSGTFRLNLSQLTQGVYIVRVGQTSYKISKR